ncbi:HAD family phosphatase [Actinobacteria bacterium IMCC26103]|nr:HAD family phosphatase [Actinobacteria bacterium IMCC26103]
MFDAVLFDMDGLFIDSEPDWHDAESEMMKANGYAWSPEDQLQCLGGPLSRVTEYMAKCLKGAKTPEELGVMIVDEMVRRMSGKVQLMPGSLGFSRTLAEAKIPQALVSASPRVIVDAVLSGMKDKYFATSVASGDIARTKPFPDPYLHAAKLLGVDIENCVIFEDSPTGLTAARASGAFVIAIPHYVTITEEARLKVVKSFQDIGLRDLEAWSEINQRELGRSL